MADGSSRLVVGVTHGTVTYLTETEGRFVPGTEQTLGVQAFGKGMVADLGPVDPEKLL
jgi:flagellar biogenesis protein FliO